MSVVYAASKTNCKKCHNVSRFYVRAQSLLFVKWHFLIGFWDQHFISPTWNKRYKKVLVCVTLLMKSWNQQLWVECSMSFLCLPHVPVLPMYCSSVVLLFWICGHMLYSQHLEKTRKELVNKIHLSLSQNNLPERPHPAPAHVEFCAWSREPFVNQSSPLPCWRPGGGALGTGTSAWASCFSSEGKSSWLGLLQLINSEY